MAGVAGVVAIALIAGSNVERAARKWAVQNEIILEDTGEILGTELIGEKDRSCAFGDGCDSSFTLQVEGENGTGEVTFSNVFFSVGRLYGAGAQWNWQDESTVIHLESGLSAEEYYSLPNYLNVLNDRLASGHFHEFTYQRAMINWVLGNKTQAYEDIRIAIGIIEGNKRSIEARNPDLYQLPREDYRVLTLFQTFDGNYSDALETVELLIASHEERERGLANDYVLRWIVQTEAGEPDKADRLLEEACNVLWEEAEERKTMDEIPTSYTRSNCGDNLWKASYEGYRHHRKGEYVKAKWEMQSYIEDIGIAILYDSDVLLVEFLMERMEQEL